MYTVGQVNGYIKNMFTQDFALRNIYVKGEVSNCKYHSSGHIYFTLKDSSGVLSAVMFAGNRKGLRFQMREGQQVIAGGSVSIYERDGKYQLYAREITLDGAGDLFRQFEELRDRLMEMGMFAPEYKQPIPRYARRVGIVTASTGAAIRDIMNISYRRNPYVQLYLYPALVQGEYAPESIVKGIETLDGMGLDCMIVGRGGGSIEDLWAFNSEKVAYAIFHARTPVISAVGHETDVTIADYAADLRAPTPSAAAELAVFDYRQFEQELAGFRQRLVRGQEQYIRRYRDKTEALRLKLALYNPRYQIAQKRQYLSELEDRVRRSMEQRILSCRHRLSLQAARLEGQSPLKKLGSGYVYARDQKGEALISVNQVTEGDGLTILMRDGRIEAEIVAKKPDEVCVKEGLLTDISENLVFLASDSDKGGGQS